METNPPPVKPDTKRFIGRCKCGFTKALDIPIKRWTETHHDHAHGQKWEVQKSRVEFEPWQRLWACPVCSTPERQNPIRWKAVKGSFSEVHKCDARCLGAKGPNCDCSCGGANHGANHL